MSKFRISKPAEKEFVDTVPFGCFRRSLFDEIGFLIRRARNEDLSLIKNIKCNKDNFRSRHTLYIFFEINFTNCFLQQFDNGK